MMNARAKSVVILFTLAGCAPAGAIAAVGERTEKFWGLDESGVFRFGPWVLFNGESVEPTSPPDAQEIAVFDVDSIGVPRQSGYDIYLDQSEHVFAMKVADTVGLIAGSSNFHVGVGGINIGLGAGREGRLDLFGTLHSAGAVRIGSGLPNLPTSVLSMGSLSRLNAAGGVTIEQDALLDAAGRVQGHVTNSGRLSVMSGGPASLSIYAGFAQTAAGATEQEAGGVMEIEIAGPSENNDVLVVQGQATLAGTLAVRRLNGYDPLPGELEARIIFAPEFYGRFDVVYFSPELRGNRRMRLNYPATALTEEERQTNAITVTVEALAPQPQLGDGSDGAADITGRPTRAVTADFNADGFVDVAATIPVEPGATSGTAGGDTIVVLNRGVDSNGAWLGFMTPISIPAGYDPADITAGDIDSDGDIDLAIINKGTPDAGTGSPSASGLRIFLNDGSAGFTQFGSPDDFVYPVGDDPRGVAMGHFIHDDPPTLDVAVTSLDPLGGGQVVVLANSGPIERRWGGFGNTETVPVNVNDPGPAAPGGLDNPKDIDDLVVGSGSGTGTNHVVTVLYNSGEAAQARGGSAFGPPVYVSVPGSPRYLAITDIDRDGDTDIISSDRTSATLSLIINDPARAGAQAGAVIPFRVQSLPIGPNPGSVGAFDFDNDLDIDLAAVTDADSRGTARVIRVLRNDTPFNAVAGPLTFSQGPVIDFGTNPQYALPGDVENDGDTDIIAFTDPPDATSQQATAFVNALCPTDLDGTGATDINDLCMFLSVFGTTGEPGQPGDLNLDGEVDTRDLVLFLARFGRACH